MPSLLQNPNAIGAAGHAFGRMLALPSAAGQNKLAAHAAVMPSQELQDRYFCQMGAALIEAFGTSMDVPVSAALRKFAKVRVFGAAGQKVASTVRDVLVEASSVRHPDQLDTNDFVKIAFLAKLKAMLGMAVGALPSTIQGGLAVGLLGGAAAGGGAWALNRQVQEDESGNEALRGKRDYYQQVAQELKDRLRNDFEPTV